MAVVSPQIALAQEIGENEGYQTYLVQIRDVEMNEAVGIEQAKALQDAGIKVIATTGGGINSGVSSIGDLFTAKGGTAVGAAIEGLANTPAGARVLGQLGVGTDDDPKVTGGNGAAAA
jgi:flotillin